MSSLYEGLVLYEHDKDILFKIILYPLSFNIFYQKYRCPPEARVIMIFRYKYTANGYRYVDYLGRIALFSKRLFLLFLDYRPIK